MGDVRRTRDELYEEAAASCGAALNRLARAYEPDPDSRRDLLQEIHVALWLSLEHYESRCSLNTWVYRVAHNTATSAVTRRKVRAPRLVGLEDLQLAQERDNRHALDRQDDVRSLWELIYTLTPHDRQIILLYLEGLDAASIGEITGFSPGNVATKIHRIKNVLSRTFHQGNTVANDENENDLRVRWQRQQPEGEDMSVNEVRVRAQNFQKRIRNENIFQYAVLIGVSAWLVGSILLFKPVMIIQVALGLLVAGSLAIGYHLHKRRSGRTPPRDLGLLPIVEFHCRELDRERDAQQSLLSWYILAVIPGLSVLIVALALGGSGRGVVPAAILAAAFAAVFTFVLHTARRTARRLQGEIDALRTYGR